MALLASMLLIFSTLGCQVPYIIKNGWDQAKLYRKREPIEKLLKDEKTKPEIKHKLELVVAARDFATESLGLNPTDNYRHFVQLETPYVTYAVQAAPSFKLESYLWWFPIVGSVPYKGFFDRASAEKEAHSFDSKKYDTYVRGVTAYSTLGWFDDPLWSSMMSYSDYDLVNTIIHETVHTTIYISSQADFNERMATFLGDYGAQLFFEKRGNTSSAIIKQAQEERSDQIQFSQFITKEISTLRAWYNSVWHQSQIDTSKDLIEQKEYKLKEIQRRFKEELQPLLKTKSYAGFATEPLNNARLVSLGTYFEDLTDFERLRDKLGPDFKTLLAYLKNLASEEKPESALKAFVTSSPPNH